MKNRRISLLFVYGLWVSPLYAAPAAITLNGAAIAADTIRWSWTAADSATTFTLLTSTGGFVANISGPAGSYSENGLPASTAIRRKLQQADTVSTTVSPLVTVGTPDASAVVPFGFPAALVGSDNLTRAALAAGALTGPGQVSVSADPLNKPLTSDTTALLALANAHLPPQRVAVTASMREFTALADGNAFTGNFSAAVTIQIPYSDVNNTGFVDGVTPRSPVATLGLYTIDPARQRWVSVPGAALDTTNKLLIANVGHFSVYGLFGSAGSADLRSLKVFPNPWRPGSGGKFDDPQGIHFQGLTPQASIKIFTVTGNIVRRIDKQITDGNEVIWDGRNADGDQTASGIYFYLVTDPAGGQEVKNRLGIIR